MPSGGDFQRSPIVFGILIRMANFGEQPGKTNVDGKLSCHFQIAWTVCSQRQRTVCVSHIQLKARNMQECPGSPRGAVNKELNSKPQTEDYNNCLALVCVCVWVCEWVFVCTLARCVLCIYGRGRLVIVPT